MSEYKKKYEAFLSGLSNGDIKTSSRSFLPLLKCLYSTNVVNITNEQLPEFVDSDLIATSIIYFLTNRESEVILDSYDDLFVACYVISRILKVSKYKNADLFVEILLTPDCAGNIHSSNIIKSILLLTTETEVLVKHKLILAQNNKLFIALLLFYVWACGFSQESTNNRDSALNILSDLDIPYDVIPIGFIHGIMMHCSYGLTSNKHVIKTNINNTIRSVFSKYDCEYIGRSVNNRPVLFIIFEIFNPHHSVYRVLGPSLQKLMQSFYVVAININSFSNYEQSLFCDEMIEIVSNSIDELVNRMRVLVLEHKPNLIIYPSVGMAPWAIYLSNIRFAPCQIAMVGHGASTCATEIDFFVVEKDISGIASTYSERLVILPASTMPYFMPSDIKYVQKKYKPIGNTIKICTIASTMKLNAVFLKACNEIVQQVSQTTQGKAVVFSIFIGNVSEGSLEASYVRSTLMSFIPHARIYFKQPFQQYVNELAENELMLTPFPFGGMNGLIDCALLGIPAICLDGPNVHEHFDAGMWERIVQTEYTVCKTYREYIEKSVKLATDEKLRAQLTREIKNSDITHAFFGEPTNDLNNVLRLLIDSKIDYDVIC